tara:strand:+ start:83 stop:229 length:147 start_codon:yes stop_codon:yes gene_type:complete
VRGVVTQTRVTSRKFCDSGKDGSRARQQGDDDAPKKKKPKKDCGGKCH